MSEGVDPFLILDGGLGSLVALSCSSDDAVSIGSKRASGPSATVWLPGGYGESGRLRRDAVARQAVLLNARNLTAQTVDGLNQTTTVGGGAGGIHPQTRLLLDAVLQARRCGCTRIVWPAHPGSGIDSESIEVEKAALIVDRALLVEQLVNLDASSNATRISIETPYADLSDRQLAELAADVSIPLKTLWWWGRASDEAQREFERWEMLFRTVGLIQGSKPEVVKRR